MMTPVVQENTVATSCTHKDKHKWMCDDDDVTCGSVCWSLYLMVYIRDAQLGNIMSVIVSISASDCFVTLGLGLFRKDI